MTITATIAYMVDAVARDPVSALDEEKNGKQENKTNVKVIAEDCHCNESLSYGEPGPLVEMLSLNLTQSPEEDATAKGRHGDNTQNKKIQGHEQRRGSLYEEYGSLEERRRS